MLGNRTSAGLTASSLVNGLKRAHRSLNARQKRIVTILSILVGSLLLRSLLSEATKASSDQEAGTVGVADDANNETGWAGSYLHKLADPNINNAVDEISKRSIYNGCQGNLLSLGKAANFSTLEEVADMLGSIEPRLSNGQQRFIQATAFSVPCQASKDGCCRDNFYFRPNSTDINVYDQIFGQQYMRLLYAIFENYTPRYVLDAGANAGFSSRLFKSLWPESVIVSVEPDYKNFEALQLNVGSLQGVHPINAGLWGRKAKIGLSGNHGEWGKIFSEVTGGPGMRAYSVNDLVRKFNVPGFDFVKIDVEGAEGKIFDPSSDFSWINSARVISLEVHDYFAGYFGLESVSPQIDAVMSGRPFTIVSDNEHVLYVSNDIINDLLKL